MNRSLPPSRDYYRRFVLGWCGGVDDTATIRVLVGSRRPPIKISEKLVEVGDVWLKDSAIPRKALA